MPKISFTDKKCFFLLSSGIVQVNFSISDASPNLPIFIHLFIILLLSLKNRTQMQLTGGDKFTMACFSVIRLCAIRTMHRMPVVVCRYMDT